MDEYIDTFELINDFERHLEALDDIWVKLVGTLGMTDTLEKIKDALNKLEEVL